LAVVVEEGAVTEMEAQTIPTSYGMVRGSIKFRLGTYTWAPKEIWFLPTGSTPSQFKSTSVYLELPENITFSTCKTSVYYNESIGYAFKVLPSAILENGTFCGLAYGGSYEVFAK